MHAEAGSFDGSTQCGESCISRNDFFDGPQFRNHYCINDMNQTAIEGHVGGNQMSIVDGEGGWINLK